MLELVQKRETKFIMMTTPQNIGKDFSLKHPATDVLNGTSRFVVFRGGTLPKTNEIVTHIWCCHNFFSLSSVQIIFIPACCLLCVL